MKQIYKFQDVHWQAFLPSLIWLYKW